MSERFLQQWLESRVAADDAIHGHNRRRRNLRPHVNEVPLDELDGLQAIAARRFLSRSSEVGGRCVNGNRALDATFEQLEAQSTDSGADIQKDTVKRTCASEHVAKQTSGRPRPFLAVTVQIALRDLLVEMRASDVPVGRAACAHEITFIVNAAYARRHSRRRPCISWPRAPWKSPENNRTAPSRRHH